MTGYPSPDRRPLTPAGFWQRAAAWSIDSALIAPLALLLAWPWVVAPAHAWVGQAQSLLRHVGLAMGEAIIDGVPVPRLANAVLGDGLITDAVASLQSSSWSLAWPYLLAFTLLGAAYHVASECSSAQASFGKRLLGVQACDRAGMRLGIARALLRYFSGALSWATLNLGHLMAMAGPRHLALHDLCSGTRVVSRPGTSSTLPAWARVWLGLLGLANLIAIGWLANAAASIMRVALEQALF